MRSLISMHSERREMQRKYYDMSDILDRHAAAVGVFNVAAVRFSQDPPVPLHVCLYLASSPGLMRIGPALWLPLKGGQTFAGAQPCVDFISDGIESAYGERPEFSHHDTVWGGGGSRVLTAKLACKVELQVFIEVGSGSACKAVPVGKEEKFEFRCPGDPDYPTSNNP